MFVLAAAVPGLLVVVVGYVVGRGLWTALAGDGGAEPAGWCTGVLLLAVTVVVLLRRYRRRRRR
ncbi:hypothetical protein [Blastococcus sp. SYSU D00820]